MIFRKKQKAKGLVKDDFGRTPTFYTISEIDHQKTKDLIDQEVDIDVVDQKGMNLLHYCATYYNLEIARYLIDKGINVNNRDNFGNNALWTAVFNSKGYSDRLELVDLLIANNSDYTTKNNAGRSPLDFAIEAGYQSVVELITASK